jgi:hypothetical protein
MRFKAFKILAKLSGPHSTGSYLTIYNKFWLIFVLPYIFCLEFKCRLLREKHVCLGKETGLKHVIASVEIKSQHYMYKLRDQFTMVTLGTTILINELEDTFDQTLLDLLRQLCF